MKTTPRQRVIGAGAAVLALAVIFFVVQGGSPGQAQATHSASVPAAVGAAPSSRTDRPPVPPLDGCSLLTTDEVEHGLGIADLPFVDRTVVTYGGNESCVWQFVSDTTTDSRSLGIGPGEPADLEEGTVLNSATGTPVSGVGGAAAWFGQPDRGVLSVGQRTEVGYLFLRVGVTRPDVDDAARLAVARELASDALPRFPGMEAPGSSPDVVTFDRQQPDTSDRSYVDNLLAREEAGDWTRGQGLVATLKLLAGELDATDVLLHPDVLDTSSAGVMSLAQQYLEDGTDEAAKAEIADLVDRLVFTREELEAATGAAPPGVRLASVVRPPPNDEPGRAGLACEDLGLEAGCVLGYRTRPLDMLDATYGKGKYQVYVASDAEKAGWTSLEKYFVAQALLDSATVYERFGTMPDVTVLLTGKEGVDVVYASPAGCGLDLNKGMVGLSEFLFKQYVARDLADCLLAATWPGKGSDGLAWWTRALALFLTNQVYTSPPPTCDNDRCDLEWRLVPDSLQHEELSTTMLERRETNEYFFQLLDRSEGLEGIRKLVDSLPAGGGTSSQAAALRAYGSMDLLLLSFAKGLTDADIADSGGGWIPYDPPFDTIQIARPLVHEEKDPKPFGSIRLQLSVTPGKYACVTYDQTDVRAAWRPGTAGPGGAGASWSSDLPELLHDDAVLVVATAGSDRQTKPHFSLNVSEVRDDSNCGSTPAPASNDNCEICGFSNFFRFADAVAEEVRQFLDGG